MNFNAKIRVLHFQPKWLRIAKWGDLMFRFLRLWSQRRVFENCFKDGIVFILSFNENKFNLSIFHFHSSIADSILCSSSTSGSSFGSSSTCTISWVSSSVSNSTCTLLTLACSESCVHKLFHLAQDNPWCMLKRSSLKGKENNSFFGFPLQTNSQEGHILRPKRTNACPSEAPSQQPSVFRTKGGEELAHLLDSSKL